MGAVHPLRDLVLVERIRETETRGGIFIPQTFGTKSGAVAAKLVAKGDHWRGRVKAVGPMVRDLKAGDEVLVYVYADDVDSSRGLFSGDRTGAGTFVRWPEDIVCAVEPE